jgi:predicted AAA+ superfamily ATPase
MLLPNFGFKSNELEIQRFFVPTLQARLNESSLPFLQVLLGPRQIGKSTAISQLLTSWPGSKIFVSADEVVPPKAEWIEYLWQRALSEPAPCLLAIDEIQKVRQWSETVKILFDRSRHSGKIKVILSGSASLSLQQGLSESLAGRYELIRCPHWGFDESRHAFGWDLMTFLKFGGYPAPAPYINEPTRWQALIRDGIVEPVIGRDLQSMISIQKPALLRQLFSIAMLYPAQEISYQKLLGQLQDRGNTATIKHYLEILKGGFLLTTLEKFGGNSLRTKSSSPKMIPLAPALVHAFTAPDRIESDSEWRGRIFEAAIGSHLHRIPGDLYYWRDGDSEVDFVLVLNQKIYAIEVKSGRRKRTNGMTQFLKKHPESRAIVLDWEKGGRFLAGAASIERLLEGQV